MSMFEILVPAGWVFALAGVVALGSGLGRAFGSAASSHVETETAFTRHIHMALLGIALLMVALSTVLFRHSV